MKYLIIPLLVLPALLMSLLPSSDPVEQVNDQPAVESTETNDDINDAKGLVVLELFTSQGCSSCPSADALLADLDAGDDEVIALSFHVDYWNYLGWEDPFSSTYFSARQSDYTEALKSRTYTPQLVINGQAELIGSRADQVRQSIARSRGAVSGEGLSFTSKIAGRKVSVTYELLDVPTGHRVTALLVQPKATSAIKRGENRGRDLHHVNVVRAMSHAPAAVTGKLVLDAPAGFDPASGEIVLLVQDLKTLAIVAAGK